MAQTLILTPSPAATMTAAGPNNPGREAPNQAGEASVFSRLLHEQTTSPQPAERRQEHGGGAVDGKDAAQASTDNAATAPVTATLAAWLALWASGAAAAGGKAPGMLSAAPATELPGAAAIDGVPSGAGATATCSGGLHWAVPETARTAQGMAIAAQPGAAATVATARTMSQGPVDQTGLAEADGAFNLPGGTVGGTAGAVVSTAPQGSVSLLTGDTWQQSGTTVGQTPGALPDMLSAVTVPAARDGVSVATTDTRVRVTLPEALTGAKAGGQSAAAPALFSSTAPAAGDAQIAAPQTASGVIASHGTAASGSAVPGVLITATGAATAARQGADHDSAASQQHDAGANQATAAAPLPTPLRPDDAVPPPTTVPTAAPLNRQDIIKQMADQAFLAVQQDRQEMHIKLKPEQLGAVTLHIAVDDGRVSARFYVDNAAVQQVLEGSLGQLRQQLAGQGLNVQHLAVFTGFSREFSQAGHQATAPHRTSRPTSLAAVETADAAPVSATPLYSTSGIDYRI